MPQVGGINVQWCGIHTRFVDGAVVVEPVVEPMVEQPPTLIDVPYVSSTRRRVGGKRISIQMRGENVFVQFISGGRPVVICF